MARTKGSFTLGGTLEIEADAPADARLQVKTKADLTASESFPYKYIGMIVSVESEQKAYMLIGSDPTLPANWKEQGAGSGESIQVDELPTAGAVYEDVIYQYVGETTANYINGYFYKCISDSEDPASYSWVEQEVQAGSGSEKELSQAAYDVLSQAEKMNGTTYYITDADANGVSARFTEMPTASVDYLGAVVQYIGATDSTYTHNYFYECVSDGESTPTYSWEQTDVQPSGGSGDASLEIAVTSNLAVGAIASGTTLPQGTTFTEFAQKLLITEIAPTTTFTASGSGVKEVGTSVTPTLTLVINSAGTGTPTAIKFYDGSTLLDTQTYVAGTNTYTFTMDAVTTTKTVKGVLEYKKSDNTDGTIEKSATYTFVMASYYGAVTTAPTDKAGIIALTKNVKNTKAQTATFTLSNQRSCYCYPASFGNLTSIKDANNFEYLSSYTKTNVTVDDVSYNVYTLTDPVTASGFKQVYA